MDEQTSFQMEVHCLDEKCNALVGLPFYIGTERSTRAHIKVVESYRSTRITNRGYGVWILEEVWSVDSGPLQS